MTSISRPRLLTICICTIIGIYAMIHVSGIYKTNNIKNQQYQLKPMDKIKIGEIVENATNQCRGDNYQEFNVWLKEIAPLIQQLSEKQRLGKARLEGHIWNFKANKFSRMPQLCSYYSVLKQIKKPNITTVCETGFNGGHSALMFRSILGNRVEIISFDLCANNNCETGKKEILNLFPNTKIRIIEGDSTVEVPVFAKRYPTKKCDFISIDGGHHGKVPYQDMRNMRRLAAEGHVFVIDDVNSASKRRYLKEVGNAWERALDENIIEPVGNCTICYTSDSSGAGCHFCFGKYIRET